MRTYQPVRVDATMNVSERAPICGMTFQRAVSFAKENFGEDAGVVRDDDNYYHDFVWIAGEAEREPI